MITGCRKGQKGSWWLTEHKYNSPYFFIDPGGSEWMFDGVLSPLMCSYGCPCLSQKSQHAEQLHAQSRSFRICIILQRSHYHSPHLSICGNFLFYFSEFNKYIHSLLPTAISLIFLGKCDCCFAARVLFPFMKRMKMPVLPKSAIIPPVRWLASTHTLITSVYVFSVVWGA